MLCVAACGSSASPQSGAVVPVRGEPGGPTNPAVFSIGVALPGPDTTPATVRAFGKLTGTPVEIAQTFMPWRYPGDPQANLFPSALVGEMLRAGITPEITWDPTIHGEGVDQPQMSLASIAHGRYDRYVRQFARAVAAVKRPVLIRFAHEMNGAWQSYSESNSGNHRGDFVKAWRHVYDVFQSVGASNARWIWSPNVVGPRSSPLAELYPGDRYVDWIGLDGYSYPKAGCAPAARTFGPALDEIRHFSTRPVMLAEVSVAASCPGRAALISNLLSWVREQPEIRSLTWWQRTDSDADWQLSGADGSASAFRQGVGQVEQAG